MTIFAHGMLLVGVAVIGFAVSVDGGQFFSRKNKVSSFGGYDFNPFDYEDQPVRIKDVFVRGLKAIAVASYGVGLALHANDATGQIRMLTMFRATGQDKLEKAVKAWRENYRDAKFALMMELPAFYFARRSISRIDDRIRAHRKIAKDAKSAKAKGQLSSIEAYRVRRTQQRIIRSLKRDWQRMAKASIGIRQVFAALDFDELWDIGRGFLFQLLAVLACGTGHGRTLVGHAVQNWCLFLNIGTLVLHIASKFDYPLTKILIKRGNLFKKSSIDPENLAIIGKVVVFVISGYVVLAQPPMAQNINSSLLASAIVMRGLRSFVQVILDWDDDDDDGIWPDVVRSLDGRGGGALMFSIATTSYLATRRADIVKLSAPGWVKKQFARIERWVDGLAHAASRIV